MSSSDTPAETTPVAVLPVSRIRRSDQTAQLDEAFAKAQAKFEAAIKSSANPFFKSNYADISSIIDATLSHLNSEGIGVKQHTGFQVMEVGGEMEAFMIATTRLTFKGEWEESDMAIPAKNGGKFDAHTCGSALTYACRYALQGIFVVRREDDDGNQATGRGSSEAAQAVGDAKVAKLKEKAAPGAPQAVPSLFYALQPSGSYAIDGDQGLMKANRDLLTPFWSQAAKSVMVTDNQLEDLKYQFEQRNVPFTALKGPKA